MGWFFRLRWTFVDVVFIIVATKFYSAHQPWMGTWVLVTGALVSTTAAIIKKKM